MQLKINKRLKIILISLFIDSFGSFLLDLCLAYNELWWKQNLLLQLYLYLISDYSVQKVKIKQVTKSDLDTPALLIWVQVLRLLVTPVCTVVTLQYGGC